VREDSFDTAPASHRHGVAGAA